MANKITIDTESLNVPWELGTTYTIEIQEGVANYADSLMPNKPLSFELTTNANPPILDSVLPDIGVSDSLVNNEIIITFDRNSIKAGTGNFYLYKVGSPDTLIATYDVTSDVTIVDKFVKLSVVNLLEASTTYYVLADNGVILDRDNFPFAGIASSSTYSFTTDAAFSADFTYVPDIDVYPDLAPQYASYYDEDVPDQLLINTPKILKDSAEEFTLTITPNPTSALDEYIIPVVDPMPNTEIIGSTLSITGTKTEINALLDELSFTPADDFDDDFELNYQLTDASMNVSNSTQPILIRDTNIEVVNMDQDRDFFGGNKNLIFSTDTPYIDDEGEPSTTEYTIELICSNGQFAIPGEISPSYNFTLTGTKSTINSKFSSIAFYPDPDLVVDSVFTYRQLKNETSLSEEITVNLIYQGENPLSDTKLIVLDEPGTYNALTTFQYEDLIYYQSYDMLLVGGGGGGGLGGGGAGGVLQKYFGEIDDFIDDPENPNFEIRVGEGGTVNDVFSSGVWTGNNGENSYFSRAQAAPGVILSADGGTGGLGSISGNINTTGISVNYTGGNSGISWISTNPTDSGSGGDLGGINFNAPTVTWLFFQEAPDARHQGAGGGSSSAPSRITGSYLSDPYRSGFGITNSITGAAIEYAIAGGGSGRNSPDGWYTPPENNAGYVINSPPAILKLATNGSPGTGGGSGYVDYGISGSSGSYTISLINTTPPAAGADGIAVIKLYKASTTQRQNESIISLSLLHSSNSDSSTIQLPSDLEDSDVGILFDYSTTTTDTTIPSGWTRITTSSSTGIRITASYKKLSSLDSNLVLTGMGNTTRKILLVFRASNTIGEVTFKNINSNATTGNPLPMELIMSTEDIQTNGSIIAFAHYAASATISPRTFTRSGGTMNTISEISGTDTRQYVKYLIYNNFSDIPGLITVDMEDEGTNGLSSFYMQVSL